MDNVIIAVRHILVTSVAAVAWLLFFPIAILFETLALIIWFFMLFVVAVFDSKELLEQSWINRYPIMPKGTSIVVKNMYLWAKALDEKPEYITGLTDKDGFVIVHAWIAGLTVLSLTIGVIILFFYLLGWWGLGLIVLFIGLSILVVGTEEAEKEKRKKELEEIQEEEKA